MSHAQLVHTRLYLERFAALSVLTNAPASRHRGFPIPTTGDAAPSPLAVSPAQGGRWLDTDALRLDVPVVSGRIGVRRLEADIGSGDRSRTDEFRAGVQGGSAWRGFAVSGAYDATLTASSYREARLDQDNQRAAADATWVPHRQVNLSLNGLHRWGATRDNTRPQATDIGETSLGANLAYLPVTGLLLHANRSYYKSNSTTGNQISDYLRLEALYQREILARTNFRTGYSQTIDIDSEGGSLPNNAAYVTLDGDLV